MDSIYVVSTQQFRPIRVPFICLHGSTQQPWKLRTIPDMFMLMICKVQALINQSSWLAALKARKFQLSSAQLDTQFWSGPKVWLTLPAKVTMASIPSSMCKSSVAATDSSYPCSKTWFRISLGCLVENSLSWFLEFSLQPQLYMTKIVVHSSSLGNDTGTLSRFAHSPRLLWLEDLETWQVRWTSGISLTSNNLVK